MQKIISLLEQKNHYLEKFYSLNEDELINFSQGVFDTVEDFYKMRDHLLKMIKYLDTEIEKVQADAGVKITAEGKAQIREALSIKDEYVNRILAQDLEILSCIEMAKSNIIRELQDIRKTKSVMGKYKSGSPGQRRLNEEV